MGQLPLDPLDQRLEQPRRPDAQSLRARSQPVRLELRLGRGRGRQPVRGRRGHRDRRLDHLPRRPTASSASSRRWAWSAGRASSRSRTARTPPGRWRAPSPTRRCCSPRSPGRTRATRFTDDRTPRLECPSDYLAQPGAGRPPRCADRRGAGLLRLQPAVDGSWRTMHPRHARVRRGSRRSGRCSPTKKDLDRHRDTRCCSTSSRPTWTPTWPRWGRMRAVHSLAEVIDFNERHADQVMPYFGQEIMVMAARRGR